MTLPLINLDELRQSQKKAREIHTRTHIAEMSAEVQKLDFQRLSPYGHKIGCVFV